MSVPTARQRARAELEQVIKETARRHLASAGASALSLRAVAREMGLASSALYRYYPSRDALLTALIVDAYDAVGEAGERAADETADADPGTRWLSVCRAVRGWALEHPHEYALVYGSPVPGYAAPQDTVGPAVRISLVMARIVTEAAADGTLRPPARPLPGPRLVTEQAMDVVGGRPAAPYEDLVERALTLMSSLFGAISYLMFGHLHRAVADEDAWFDAAMAVCAEGVGLDLPLG